MSGIRPEWMAGNDFIMVHRGLVAALDGDYEAAMVVDRINYRAGRDGWWTCSAAEMQDETCLTEWKLRRALTRLRDAGFITSTRVNRFESTLKWQVVREESDTSGPRVSSTPGPRIPQSPESEDSSVPSTKNLEEPSSAVVGRARDLAPEVHPQRPIAAGWTPSREWISHLRVTYPDVQLMASCTRFVNHHLARKDTTRSWEALFENWVSSDQQRINETKLAGTDDLGVPGTQRSTSVVGDALKPGDEGYFDPTAYLEQHPPGSD